MIEVNGAGTLLVVNVAVIPSRGGDTRSSTFGFPAIEPVTLTVNEAVCPGAMAADAGVTERSHVVGDGACTITWKVAVLSVDPLAGWAMTVLE
jgi:hypothetical protein